MKKLDVSKYNSGGELAEIAIKVNEIIDNGTAGCGECQKDQKEKELIEKFANFSTGSSDAKSMFQSFLNEYKSL